jgi:hypothetical protein
VQHGGNNSIDEVGSATPINASVTYFSMKGKTYCNSHALLATAMVQVKDRDGNLQECCALLDSASRVSFISKDVAKELKSKLDKHSLPINGINNVPAGKICHTCSVEVFSTVSDYNIIVNCAVIGNVTGLLPSMPIDLKILLWMIQVLINLTSWTCC